MFVLYNRLGRLSTRFGFEIFKHSDKALNRCMDTTLNQPWLKPNDAPYFKFYHLDAARKNNSAIYAPALDRFILVDNCDFWTVFETAKILSSKIATQLFLLSSTVPHFTNENCFEYTIANKSAYMINGSNIVSARQTPIMNNIAGEGLVIKVGLPTDFQDPQRYKHLSELKEYTLFVLRCVHAIKFTDAFVHVPSIEEMIQTYAPDLVPSNINLSLNYTSIPGGMKQHVLGILYNASTIEEALAQINDAWDNNSVFDDKVFKEIFNYFMGLGPAPQLK